MLKTVVALLLVATVTSFSYQGCDSEKCCYNFGKINIGAIDINFTGSRSVVIKTKKDVILEQRQVDSVMSIIKEFKVNHLNNFDLSVYLNTDNENLEKGILVNYIAIDSKEYGI
ncbi:MAG: hypothetical protein ACRC7R_01425 [Sarcina sp.]